MLLIGSRALRIVEPRAIHRKPLDFDFIGTRDEFNSWVENNSDKIEMKRSYEISPNKMVLEGTTMVEFEIVQPGSSSELLIDLVKNDPNTIDTKFGLVPSLNLLFAIKSSHRFKKFSTDAGARMWWKTLIDWHSISIVKKTFNIPALATTYSPEKDSSHNY